MNTQILQFGDKAIPIEQVPWMMRRYQLMTQFMRGMIIDKAIADIDCTEPERQSAVTEFEKQHQITSAATREVWLQSQGLTLEQMEDLALLPLKIQKFKMATWGRKLESYFLTRKSSLDQVIYSLICTKDQGLAYEIYFRIQEGEQSFSELAREYSQGSEASTGGLLGPIPLSQPHPNVSKILSISQVGQLWSPRKLADYFLIIRLEKMIPAQFNEVMQQRLLNELFEGWIKEQVQQINSLNSIGDIAA